MKQEEDTLEELKSLDSCLPTGAAYFCEMNGPVCCNLQPPCYKFLQYITYISSHSYINLEIYRVCESDSDEGRLAAEYLATCQSKSLVGIRITRCHRTGIGIFYFVPCASAMGDKCAMCCGGPRFCVMKLFLLIRCANIIRPDQPPSSGLLFGGIISNRIWPEIWRTRWRCC